MVIDTSALLAVLFDEPERDTFIALLAGAEDALISAGTLLEASIVMQARTGDDGVADLDELLAAAAVRCVAPYGPQAKRSGCGGQPSRNRTGNGRPSGSAIDRWRSVGDMRDVGDIISGQ